MLIADLVKVARQKLDAKLDSSPSGLIYWQAASEALAELERRVGVLDGVPEEEARRMIFLLINGDDLEERVGAILVMDADAVIGSLEQGTKELRLDTQRRAEIIAALREIALALGDVGLRLLHSLLVGLVLA